MDYAKRHEYIDEIKKFLEKKSSSRILTAFDLSLAVCGENVLCYDQNGERMLTDKEIERLMLSNDKLQMYIEELSGELGFSRELPLEEKPLDEMLSDAIASDTLISVESGCSTLGTPCEKYMLNDGRAAAVSLLNSIGEGLLAVKVGSMSSGNIYASVIHYANESFVFHVTEFGTGQSFEHTLSKEYAEVCRSKIAEYENNTSLKNAKAKIQEEISLG